MNMTSKGKKPSATLKKEPQQVELNLENKE